MSDFKIDLKKSDGTESTINPDKGLSYTEDLNKINSSQIKVSGTGKNKRSLFDVGDEIFIYRDGSLEHHGFLNALSFLDAGGLSLDCKGYEFRLTNEKGDYANSPYTSTASSTIFSDILSDSSYLDEGTIETGSDIDFRLSESESIWNALTNLRQKVQQDVVINYFYSSTDTVDVLNHAGSSTSVENLHDGKDFQNMSIRKTFPRANYVVVYGKSEGETRVKSDSSHGQDSTSQSNYGTIKEIYRDKSVTSQSEANQLADALVNKWSNPGKKYVFDMINPGRSFNLGDVVSLNSNDKDLTDEEVRIVKIQRGVKDDKEFLSIEVTNKELSESSRNLNEKIAEVEKRARDNETYDQFNPEYSNQNKDTTVGGIVTTSQFDNVMDLGGTNYIRNVAGFRGVSGGDTTINADNNIELSPEIDYSVIVRDTLNMKTNTITEAQTIQSGDTNTTYIITEPAGAFWIVPDTNTIYCGNTNNSVLKRVKDPTDSNDAATKNYVDNNTGDDLGNHTATQDLNMSGYNIDDINNLYIQDLYASADASNGNIHLRDDFDAEEHIIGATANVYAASDDVYLCGVSDRRWTGVHTVTLYEGDHVFTERKCDICDKEFKEGEATVNYVLSNQEEGTRTIPVHLECYMQVKNKKKQRDEVVKKLNKEGRNRIPKGERKKSNEKLGT